VAVATALLINWSDSCRADFNLVIKEQALRQRTDDAWGLFRLKRLAPPGG